MIVGHERNVKFLEKILVNHGETPHGFLFFGPEDVGKKTIAFEFGKGFLCVNPVRSPSPKGDGSRDASSRLTSNGASHKFGGCGECSSCEEFFKLGIHPTHNSQKRVMCGVHRDLFFWDENKAGGIDEAHAAIKFFSTSPQLADKKVLIIDSAERLTSEAQNALLKTLEEPNASSVIILISSKPAKVYDTIRSRLLQLRFNLLSSQELVSILKPKFGEKAVEAAKLCFGRPGRAYKFIEDPKKLAEELKDLKEIDNYAERSVFDKIVLARKMAEKGAKEEIERLTLVSHEKFLRNLDAEEKVARDKIRKTSRFLRDLVTASVLAEDSNVNKEFLLENLMLNL